MLELLNQFGLLGQMGLFFFIVGAGVPISMIGISFYLGGIVGMTTFFANLTMGIFYAMAGQSPEDDDDQLK